MKEYIIREAYVGMFNGEHNLYSWDEIDEYMQSIPAADVRPVVLCRDCKHWETEWTPQGVSDGRHYCAPLDLFPSADWYCSDGEKMEER